MSSRSAATRAIELELCRRSVFYWFSWWPWTYDPRRIAGDEPNPDNKPTSEDAKRDWEASRLAWMPMDLFPRQVENIEWLDERIRLQEDGLEEKSRDIGFTWMAAGYAWHAWRFKPGFKTTFGSRVTDLVDTIGDPDSIFEKIRLLQNSLPEWMLPRGFDPGDHDKWLLLVNPQNDNVIRGEGGKNMGRGGRSTLYIIDEGAHVEQAERVEAATGANTDCRIWASSVNGMDNFFARKRFGGSLLPRQIFRFHYSDDPRKTPEWAAKKKASMELHNWNAEYEIDYTASVEGIVIPASYVQAAKDIRKWIIRPEDEARSAELAGKRRSGEEDTEYRELRRKLEMNCRIQPDVDGIAGGDIGAGKAKSVFVARFGPVVLLPKSWGDPDTTETALRLLDESANTVIIRPDGYECRIKHLHYDAPGVGAGVTSTLKRSHRQGLAVHGINTGDAPSETRWADGRKSTDKFLNLKADIWWIGRDRFFKTWETLMWFEDRRKEDGTPLGKRHPDNELILLPADNEGPDALTLSAQLSTVRAYRRENGKTAIESKVDTVKGKHHHIFFDHADALVLTFVPTKAAQWAAFAGVQL